MNKNFDEILEKLSKSGFRKKFRLSAKDIAYIDSKGLNVIESHAVDFVNKRIAPEFIPNDGKQTPMRNHPVFVAQHATATCCRSCVQKWYNFPKAVELSDEQKTFIVSLIMSWIRKQYNNSPS